MLYHIKKEMKKFHLLFYHVLLKGPIIVEKLTLSKYRHKASSGTGAVTSISCFETGCINDMRRA